MFKRNVGKFFSPVTYDIPIFAIWLSRPVFPNHGQQLLLLYVDLSLV